MNGACTPGPPAPWTPLTSSYLQPEGECWTATPEAVWEEGWQENHCGFKRHTLSSLPASSPSHVGPLACTCHHKDIQIQRYIEAHESSQGVTHPSMLPHVSTGPQHSCVHLHPSASSPTSLVCSYKFDTLLPAAWSALPPPALRKASPQKPPTCKHLLHIPAHPTACTPIATAACPQAHADTCSPAQASNSKSRNIQVHVAAGGGLPMVGSGGGRAWG